jgi:hypothetical protein
MASVTTAILALALLATVAGHQEEDTAAPPPESAPTWDSFAAAAMRELTNTISDQGATNIQPWCPAESTTIRDAGETLFLLLVRRAMRQLGGAFKPSHHSES